MESNKRNNLNGPMESTARESETEDQQIETAEANHVMDEIFNEDSEDRPRDVLDVSQANRNQS